MSGVGPDGATRLMVESLDALGDVRAPLVVGEASGVIARACEQLGAGCTSWLREAVAGSGVAAEPWPPTGAFDGALVRLPKAKPALRMALHAVASRIPAGSPIAVFGGNDEGIRSAARVLDEVAEEVATLAVGHHARVISGRRKPAIPGLKGDLAGWRETNEIEIGGERRTWVSYPGTFAKGGLDAGTAFLLGHLPDMAQRPRVLDFAAGTGVIAAAILDRCPDADIDMIDADAVAIEAARQNVPGACGLVGDSLAACQARGYDLIVSNPPVHEGIAESRRVLDRLISEAPSRLAPAGRLVLVVQRRIAVMPSLTAAFGAARVIADDGRYTVAMAELTGKDTSASRQR